MKLGRWTIAAAIILGLWFLFFVFSAFAIVDRSIAQSEVVFYSALAATFAVFLCRRAASCGEERKTSAYGIYLGITKSTVLVIVVFWSIFVGPLSV